MTYMNGAKSSKREIGRGRKIRGEETGDRNIGPHQKAHDQKEESGEEKLFYWFIIKDYLHESSLSE
jgi:hypothetical protein